MAARPAGRIWVALSPVPKSVNWSKAPLGACPAGLKSCARMPRRQDTRQAETGQYCRIEADHFTDQVTGEGQHDDAH